MNRSYSPSDKNKVFKMRTRGHTLDEISIETNIPRTTLHYWIKVASDSDPILAKRFKAPYRKAEGK